MIKHLKNLFRNDNNEEKLLSQQQNTIDFFDEECRQNIYLWSAKRVKKEQKSYWYHLKIYVIDWALIKTFFDGITLMVALSMLLTCLFTYFCVRMKISFNFQASMIVSPLVFPLSFLIRGDFQRRERALDFLSDFRSSIYSLYLLCREWRSKLDVSENVVTTIMNKLLQLVVHVREYLQTRSPSKRTYLVQIIYEDISDLTELLEMYHNQKIAGIAALISRLHYTEQTLIGSFEKLRVIRDYRSPRSARSFTKIMMFITPILFSPLYTYMGSYTVVTSSWAPYVFGAITAFVFGCLQSVQDRLDDPFLGVTYDEINLDDLHNWANESLKRNANRTDVIGRFTVKFQDDASHEIKETPERILENKLIHEHPYLCALKAASSIKTIRITNTQEIKGRNRVIFLSNVTEEDQVVNAGATPPGPSVNVHLKADK